MREVDFAKQKTVGEKNSEFQIFYIRKINLSLSLAYARQLPRQREPYTAHVWQERIFIDNPKATT